MKSLRRLLLRHGACNEGLRWGSRYTGGATAWRYCKRVDWLWWGLNRIVYSVRPEAKLALRRFALRCLGELALENGKPSLTLFSPAARHAIEVMWRFLDGGATLAELQLANEKLVSAPYTPCNRTVREAISCCRSDFSFDVLAQSVSERMPRLVANAVTDGYKFNVHLAAERDVCRILREEVGNPFSVKKKKKKAKRKAVKS